MCHSTQRIGQDAKEETQSNSLPSTFSKPEAIDALKNGKKVTHIYFTPEEFIFQRGKKYVDENGFEFHPLIFWMHRDSEAFQTGWSIYDK